MTAGGAAADAQRQGRPPGAAGAGRVAAGARSRRYVAPRDADGGSGWRRSGREVLRRRSRGRARQLLRAGRALAPGGADGLARAARAGAGAAAGRGVHGADRGGGWRERIDAAHARRRAARCRPVPRVPRDGELPLSFAQQRFWFLDQLQPGNPAYNLFTRRADFGRSGHARRCERGGWTSWCGGTRRLRTTFPTADGQPRQVIAPAGPLGAARGRLARLGPRPSATRRCGGWWWRETPRPVRPGGGPLLRVLLVARGRRRARAHRWRCTTSSPTRGRTECWSASSRSSIGPLPRGRKSPLAGTGHPIRRLRRMAARDGWRAASSSSDLGYWRTQLDKLPALGAADRPAARGAGWTAARPYTAFKVRPRLVRGSCATGAREGVTPFMVFLAALRSLLHRYSGQDDFALGMTSGQPQADGSRGARRLLRQYARAARRPCGDPSFRELVARAANGARRLLTTRICRLSDWWKSLHRRASRARNPFCQVLINYPTGDDAHAPVQPSRLNVGRIRIPRPAARAARRATRRGRSI